MVRVVMVGYDRIRRTCGEGKVSWGCIPYMVHVVPRCTEAGKVECIAAGGAGRRGGGRGDEVRAEF